MPKESAGSRVKRTVEAARQRLAEVMTQLDRRASTDDPEVAAMVRLPGFTANIPFAVTGEARARLAAEMHTLKQEVARLTASGAPEVGA